MTVTGGLGQVGRIAVLVGRCTGLCWRAGRWVFVGAAAAQLIAAVTLLLQLLAARWLLSEVLGTARPGLLGRVAAPLALLVTCLAVAAIGNVVRTSLQPMLAERISRHTLEAVMVVAAEAELENFESPELFDRLHHTTIRAATRPLQMATGVLSFIAGLGGVAGVGAALVGISPWLVLLVIAGGVPAYLASTRTGRRLYAFERARSESDRRRSYLQLLLLTRDPAKEVRGYQLESQLVRRWRAISDARLVDLRRLTAARLRIAVASALIGALLTGAAVTVLLLLVQRGDIGLAGAGTGALALLLLAGQTQVLLASIVGLQDSATFVEDYLSFVATRTTPRFTGTAEPDEVLRELTVEGVGFAYPGGRPVLHHVDLQVRPGGVTALVGPNGSGKTTLVKLLCGLYPASTGRLAWNDVAFDQLDVQALRSRITPVFQDPARFQVTVEDYVALGRSDRPADRDRIVASLERADIAAAFTDTPAGLTTQLGPEFLGGADLSGGQWQRLALARALYRRGELVVLDEPASALDPLAEAELFGHVRSLFPGAAVVIVSHRFGSVRDADEIHVVDGGRIVETGDHHQLMDKGGLYARMFEAQKLSLLGD